MWRFHRYFCRFKGRNTWFSALWKVFRVRHHSNLLYFACHLCSTVMYLYSMNILLRVTLVIVQIFVTFQLNNYRIAHTPIIKSAFQPLVKVAWNFWNFWKIILAQYQRKTSVQAPGVGRQRILEPIFRFNEPKRGCLLFQSIACDHVTGFNRSKIKEGCLLNEWFSHPIF